MNPFSSRTKTKNKKKWREEKKERVQSVLSGRTFKKIYPESVRVPSSVVKIVGPLLIVPCNYFMPVTGNSTRADRWSEGEDSS